MQTENGTFQTTDGQSLFWKAFLPEGEIKAVLQVFHGISEHIDRYVHVIDELVPAGFAVIGNDHRGHGRSSGKRCYVSSFQEYMDDEYRFRQEIVIPRFTGMPHFILGHSMGSIIAMHYVRQHPEGLRGLVLSGTGSTPGPLFNKATIMGLKLFSRLLPGLQIRSPLPPEVISHDPVEVRAYVNDPLVSTTITPRLVEQINAYLESGVKGLCALTLPVLIQFGSEDTSFRGQEELFRDIGARDKTFFRYDGLRHEVYNELIEGRTRALADLRVWMNNHL